MTPEEQKQFDELKAAHDGYNAANLKNQQALDEALQKLKDQAAEHEAAVAAMKDEHGKQLKAAADTLTQQIESLNTQHVAAMKAQADALANQHAAEIATLKASVLVPSLKDMQARQAADLAAKHEAELARLQ